MTAKEKTLPKWVISAEDVEKILDPSKRDPEIEARRLATLRRIKKEEEERIKNGEPLFLLPGQRRAIK